jgi:hypothetical protein
MEKTDKEETKTPVEGEEGATTNEMTAEEQEKENEYLKPNWDESV